MMDTVVYDAYQKVDIDEFLPELRLEIPELPDDVLMSYVRRAAIDFCERSRVLQRVVTICLQECVPNYLLESPDCMRIVAVTGICRSCGGDYQRLTSSPCHVPCLNRAAWWDQNEGSIWLHPAPSQPDNIMVRVAVAPEQDACELDAVLFNKYREAIIAGTRSFLYAIPRREWSSQPQADAARAEFDRRIASAGVDRLLGGQQGTTTMRTVFNRRSR